MLKFGTYLQLHFFELKIYIICLILTFIYLFLISYLFFDQIIYLCIHIINDHLFLQYFIFTDLTEKVTTNLFISSAISFFFIYQIFFLQIWFFLKKGLFKYENYKFIKLYLLFVLFNIILIFFILLKFLPTIWFFFTNTTFSNIYLYNIYFEPKLNNFFYFIIISFSYIYLIYMYFFIFLYLLFSNLFKMKTIIKLRNFFYLKFLLISILITPPDFLNQLLIFSQFVFFFEFLIFNSMYLFKYFFKKN